MMYLTFKKGLIIALVFLMSNIILSAQTIVYVNAAATGANTGLSWSDAYTELVDAVAAAPTDAEIWIAQTTTEGYAVTKSSNRSESIFLSKPLTFVGGFMGTETTKEERVDGQHTIISGELGNNIDLTDNSNIAFQIKNTAVVFQGILFRKFYSKYAENGNSEYGAIVADTNAIVTISECSFIQNEGNPNGACISAFKGSEVIIDQSSFVDNTKLTNGSIIGSKDGAVIRITDANFSNNGGLNASYIFYCSSNVAVNNALQDKLLLDLNRVGFNNNQMPISYSYEGSANFSNCSFNLSKTTQSYFNYTGDSATFQMDNCLIDGAYETGLFGIYGMKNFVLTNSQIFNPALSQYGLFELSVSKSVAISKTSITNVRGSIPINIYSPKGDVNFNDVTISDGDVSSYILHINANKLTCANLKLINNKAGVGNYYSCRKANFSNCLISGFEGGDVLSCNYTPAVTFDNCVINGINQRECLFQIDSILSVTNCNISGISKTINNPGRAMIFSIWNGQSLFAANNIIDNISTSGNLVDNAGDMFIGNCEFKNLTITNLKSVFNNSGKLWVYNSNINSNYNIPFLNDTSYYGKINIDFRLINSIVYTQQDTVIKNMIMNGNTPFSISNNISNKKISGMNSVSECNIAYTDLYDDAYSIIYNKGLTPTDAIQYPLVDLYGKPRIVGSFVDIGIKEYQVTTAVLSKDKDLSLRIYPNPTKQFIHFTSIGVGTLSITDYNGKVCFVSDVTAGENVLDISTLSASIYFVGVVVNDITTVNKLVVVK